MLHDKPLVFTLRDQIVEQLRNDVLCGRFAEGERLTLMQLVERFGVSRTPVREALQLLTHEGLLEGRPNASVRVARRPPDSLRELVLPIRRSVETFALRSYFGTLDESDFAHWGEILERMRRACLARDYPAIAEHDVAFHRALVRRAGQVDLELIWNSIVARIRHHFWETQQTDYEDPIEIYEEHMALLATFRSGNVEHAITTLENNIGSKKPNKDPSPPPSLAAKPPSNPSSTKTSQG